MKIRTDFVTNSSSSSFVAYRVKSEDLVDFLDKMYLEVGRNRYLEEAWVNRDNLITLKTIGGDRMSWQYLLYIACSGDFADDWDTDHEETFDTRQNLKKVPYRDYTFQNGFPENVVELKALFEELFTKTDVAENANVEKTVRAGGGEMDGFYDKFADYNSSGYEETYENGKLRNYRATPYNGGAEYTGKEHISYDCGRLSVFDAESECAPDFDIVWDNEHIHEAIDSAKNLELYGLKEIGEFCCEEVTKIIIPDCVEKIADGAFAECPELENLTIEGKDTVLGETIVEKNVTIHGYPNSTAEAYAKKNGNPFIPIDA